LSQHEIATVQATSMTRPRALSDSVQFLRMPPASGSPRIGRSVGSAILQPPIEWERH
jgi:hypothetical protein